MYDNNKCKFENVLIKINSNTSPSLPLCIYKWASGSGVWVQKDCCFPCTERRKRNTRERIDPTSGISIIWMGRSGWIIYSSLLKIIKVTIKFGKFQTSFRPCWKSSAILWTILGSEKLDHSKDTQVTIRQILTSKFCTLWLSCDISVPIKVSQKDKHPTLMCCRNLAYV